MEAVLPQITPDLLSLLWLIGLTCAMLFLWGRVAALHERQAGMQESLERIGNDLAGLRLELRGLARAQQVDDMRRTLLAELRPMLADAIALQSATKRGRPGKQIGIEFEGNATITGAVAGGGMGQLTTGGIDGGSSGKPTS